MRIKSFAAFALMLSATISTSTFGQDDSSAGISKFAWRQSPATAPQPTTVLRATTGTGISNAVIDRQETVKAEPEGVRVAMVPDVRVAKARPVIERLASRASNEPKPPEMARRPFLVGFRRSQNTAPESVLAPATEGALSVGGGEIPAAAPQPSVPNADNYTGSTPNAPQTNEADAQVAGTAPEPALSVASNSEPERDYCGRDCRKSCCNLGCEKKLFPKYCSGLEIGGWTNSGYHNRNTIMTNNRSGELNLHQAWLYADKAASQDSCNWDFGYRADLLYGIDAQDLQAFGNGPTGAPSGWDNDWDHGSYGWALPQLYVELANYDWNVKIGKFFSPFGYEVIGAPDNFFYSHSFTMYNSEPFTMSGVLAERKVSDTKSYVFGATAGWDTGFENNEGGGNIIFGSREQVTEDINFAVTNSWGDAGTRGNGSLTSAVATVELTENLQYVFQGDVLNLDENNEFGVIHYLFREVTPCLSLGTRLEWWKSNQFFASTRSTYNFTMGANYRKSANTVIRPELRFDWGAAAVDPGTPIIGIDFVTTF